MQFLLDTGATGYAFIDEKAARLVCQKLNIAPIRLSYPRHVRCFNGEDAKPITHAIYPALTVQDHKEITAPLLITKIGEHSLILGLPWFNKHQPLLDGKNNSLHFKPGRCNHGDSSPRKAAKAARGTPKQTDLYEPPSNKPAAVSLISKPPEYRILSKQEEPIQGLLAPVKRPSKATVEDAPDENDKPLTGTLDVDSPWSLIEANENSSLGPESTSPKQHKNPIRIADTIAKARSSTLVTRPIRHPGHRKKTTRRGSKSPKDLSPMDPGSSEDNPTEEPLDMAFIGAAAFQNLLSSRKRKNGYKAFSLSMKEIDEALKPLEAARSDPPEDLEIHTVTDVTSATLEQKVPKFLHKFKTVLNPKEAENLPPHRAYDHKIELTSDAFALPKSRVYSLSPKKLEALQKYLKENLKKGFISPSNAPFASPILFVVKPNGQLRLCVDYRKLNAITKRNTYPIPLIEETLARVIGCKHISKLDIISAFNKLRMETNSEDFTTFICSLGIYKYHVLPFGLTNGPASWQHYMNDLLFEYLNKFCQAYLDDILIYSKTRKEHEKHLEQVFSKLEKAGLQVDINKCEFFKTEVAFLGVILSTDGLRMDPNKVQDIVNWERPTCLKEVQAFVGFCNFYRRFIKAFSHLAKPLTRMARKEVGFEWTDPANDAFEALKKYVTEAPILRHYDRKKKAVLETDSSDWCLGGVLSQYDDDEELHPIAFYSKKMIPAECNYEIYDKELLAIIRCLEHWRPELEGTEEPVEIYTDHKGLETFMTSKKLTPRQVRWAEILADYNIKIQYQTGAKNVKADALTRMPGFRPGEEDDRQRYREQVLLPPSRLHLCPIDAVDDLYERILQANKDSEECSTLRTAIEAEEPTAEGINLQGCTIRDGALYKDDNLWVPGELGLLMEVIRDAHDQPSCAHPGMNRTEELIKRYYYWPNMRKVIKRYIRNCHSCQRAKPSHDGLTGLLRPLPIPAQRWVDISMDFIVGLPDSEGHNAICTIIDRLSKERHYAPCTAGEEGTAVEACVRILLHYVFRTHGLPSSIISDRGPQFVSTVWKSFCKRLGIKSKLSTAFHPKTDGQTERANQDIETRLRHYCNYAQDNWARWIDILKFADNDGLSAATGLTPFFVNKEYHPRMTFGPDITNYESTRERLLTGRAENISTEMERIVNYAKEHAINAVKRMIARANQHRRPIEFEIGDHVWLDRRNIKTARPSDKLDDKNLRPYLVTNKRGQAYELKLPDIMHIHPVFHSWLLRKDPQDPLPGQENEPPEPVILGEDPE